MTLEYHNNHNNNARINNNNPPIKVSQPLLINSPRALSAVEQIRVKIEQAEATLKALRNKQDEINKEREKCSETTPVIFGIKQKIWLLIHISQYDKKIKIQEKKLVVLKTQEDKHLRARFVEQEKEKYEAYLQERKSTYIVLDTLSQWFSLAVEWIDNCLAPVFRWLSPGSSLVIPTTEKETRECYLYEDLFKQLDSFAQSHSTSEQDKAIVAMVNDTYNDGLRFFPRAQQGCPRHEKSLQYALSMGKAALSELTVKP